MKKDKIILIGDGAVGSSYAYALTLLGVGRELGIIDLNKEKTVGDAMDLEDALAYTSPKEIYPTDYSDCADANIVVITAGAAQKPGETRLDLVDKNLKIFKGMISQVMESGFDGIFLIASNPVDILTYATWKLSGLPAHRVIGSGTSLDSSRLRQAVAELLSVDARNVHAYIMGEHGDSEFAVWSHANVGGMQLYEWVNEHSDVDEMALLKAVDSVKNKAYEIIQHKGATFYGIGTALARITKAILRNENSIHPVSAYLAGEYGLHDIFIGAPAIINSEGVRWVMDIPLTDNENERMQASAKTLKETLKNACSRLGEQC